MVALRTHPPSNSGKGGTSVPPPAKLSRSGDFDRISMRSPVASPPQFSPTLALEGSNLPRRAAKLHACLRPKPGGGYTTTASRYSAVAARAQFGDALALAARDLVGDAQDGRGRVLGLLELVQAHHHRRPLFEAALLLVGGVL